MSRKNTAIKVQALRPGMRWALGLSAGATALALLLPGQAPQPAGGMAPTQAAVGAATGVALSSSATDTRSQPLPERLVTVMLEAAEGDPFGTPALPPTAPAPPTVVAPPAPPAPTAPVLNYRYLGQMTDLKGERKVYLARPDKELLVEQGTLLDEGYRVEAITADEVKLIYEPLQHRSSIRIPRSTNPS